MIYTAIIITILGIIFLSLSKTKPRFKQSFLSLGVVCLVIGIISLIGLIINKIVVGA
ncbi:hypothetical protein N9R04_10400 [Staphylococcus sp. SQ8-PEA]|uniref:Uncharacterized protein n=1 Tax=Staphylococcus marylandisciuri TaxID=2981529 RepID=A0ABT2QSZ9_9STAP|nr:hypothetical protein [Staphylococcus marylandisciuri]MCU5747072.1 hypothetical protein [Staphylococcus marylandisciuri]